MNTATISPALEIATSKPTPPKASKQADTDDSSPRFSDVLSNQHASQQARTNTPVSDNSAAQEKETLNNGAINIDTETLADGPKLDLLKLATEAGLVSATIVLAHTEKIAVLAATGGAGSRLGRQPAITPEHFQRGLQSTSDLKTATNTLRFSSVATPVHGQTDKAALPTSTLNVVAATDSKAATLAAAPNVHQSASPDGKAKLASAKTALAAMTTDSSKTNPGAGKTTVSEFSSAMVDAATLAQSRFTDYRQHEASTNTSLSTEHAIAQVTQGSGSAITSNGSLAAIPGAPTPLSSPQWATDFGRQFVNIAQNSSNGTQIAELRLDPPELGPLRITISLSDNVAHAAFISPHAMVRQTVENALPQLQQLLAQAGISLGDTSVSDQGQQAGQAFDDSNNKQHANHGGIPGTAGATLAGHASDTTSVARSRAPDALVDTFA